MGDGKMTRHVFGHVRRRNSEPNNRLFFEQLEGRVLLAVTVAEDIINAHGGVDRPLPDHIAALRMNAPVAIEIASSFDGNAANVEGPLRVIVQLRTPSLAESGLAEGTTQQEYVEKLKAEQREFLQRLPDVPVLGQTQRVLNAVFLDVDEVALHQVAQDSRVKRIAPVGDYELDLSETVPYIGASAVQNLGFDGSGISVAVLDSGVDYYHANMFGSGDPADYAADDPTIVEPGTFPTDKVVGGFDFVGSQWFSSFAGPPEMPDPDPLDDGPGAGHGTHVADIVGGRDGVAPGVDIYALKVCSSISTACSGIAQILALEFAVDPDADGKTSDHVDIVNMSLGLAYGQPFDDDVTLAVDHATALGVLTVASAGNSGDKPYVVGAPAAADTALSVAQTHVPSARLQLMQVLEPAATAGFYPAVFQPWSAPLTIVIEAPLVFGGDFGSSNACSVGADPNSENPADSPYPPGTFSGKMVLVDRGECNFSTKIRNIEVGGGSIGVIGLVAPGDPFVGGFGGTSVPGIPGYMISQADSNALKSQLPDPGVTARFDPSVVIPQVMSIVGSSSRGPENYGNMIKPEIGAPGASVSAIAGSGTGTGSFGGTSGAAPMVSGSAALLLEGFRTNQISQGHGTALGLGLEPHEVKALLMNTAETDIVNDVILGDLAPISRIGGGEVRVDQANSAKVAAWDAQTSQGALSFGFVDVADDVLTLTRTVQIHNFSQQRRTYTITPTFRFADDVASGAVSVSTPGQVVVQPGFGRDTFFDVTLTVDGTKLRGNFMNSGSRGADGTSLSINEYDGYLVLDDGQQILQLPWHILPRKAARVVPERTTLDFSQMPFDVIGLDNTGVGTAQNGAYSLLAVSPNQPRGGRGEQMPMPDIHGVGVRTFTVPAGFCSAEPSFVWSFAVNTWERQTHVLPVSHEVWLDTDQNGEPDFVVLNRDFSFSGISDGRQLSWAVDLATGIARAFFFAEHATNTGNTVLTVCGEQVGLTGTDIWSTNVDSFVATRDIYFGGPGDIVTGLTITPLGERYVGLTNDVPANTADPAGLVVLDFGPFPGNSPELGVMMLTNGDRGSGARGGATMDTEALFIGAPGIEFGNLDSKLGLENLPPSVLESQFSTVASTAIHHRLADIATNETATVASSQETGATIESAPLAVERGISTASPVDAVWELFGNASADDIHGDDDASDSTELLILSLHEELVPWLAAS
jgi:minor extracellular serine protease Vpr